MKPTEGPYQPQETGDGAEWFVYAGPTPIAHCYNGAMDARLLAKSWEMREALSNVLHAVGHVSTMTVQERNTCNEARALLASIDGDSQ